MQGAWKVGLLVVVFVGLLLGGYAVLGQSLFAEERELYYADFEDAGGINAGSKVLLAGVNVGQVTAVDLVDARRARLTLALRKGLDLPEGTVARVPTALIGIGDRQIELTPPLERTSARLKPGATLLGELASPLEDILPDTGETMAKLNETLEAATNLMSDQELKGALTALLEQSTDTAARFGSLATEFEGAFADNRATLTAALQDGAKVMEDMAALSEQIAGYAKSGKLEGQIDGLLVQLDQTLESGNGLIEDMRAFVTDPELRASLDKIVGDTAVMTDSGTRIAANAETMAENGVVLSEKAIEIAEKASKLADGAQEILDQFQKTLGGVKAGSGFLNDVEVEADVFRETDPARWRTEFNAVVPIGQDKLHVGLWDAFESNKLNAQLAKQLDPNLQLRYGVFASQPGLGVDYRVAPRVLFRADGFGLNEPRLDVRGRYDFGRGIYGWVGLERIFERNAPSIGIGVRR